MSKTIYPRKFRDVSNKPFITKYHYSSLLLEYSAFLKLRWSKPDLERPYRIPFSNYGCIFLLLPAMLCTILIMALASWSTYIFCLGTIVICTVWWQFKAKRENYTTVSAKEGDESESTSNII